MAVPKVSRAVTVAMKCRRGWSVSPSGRLPLPTANGFASFRRRGHGDTLRGLGRSVNSKHPRGGGEAWPGVLECEASDTLRCCHATDMHHLTHLTGPRASIHKVLSPPLVVGTEDTQWPHSAGRLFPRTRRPVIRTRVPISPWGELRPTSTRLSHGAGFFRVLAAPQSRLAGVQWRDR